MGDYFGSAREVVLETIFNLGGDRVSIFQQDPFGEKQMKFDPERTSRVPVSQTMVFDALGLGDGVKQRLLSLASVSGSTSSIKPPMD